MKKANLKTQLLSLVLLAACSHQDPERTIAQSRDDGGDVGNMSPTKVVTKSINFPITEDNEKPNWILVRGRLPYKLTEKFERKSEREFLSEEEESRISPWLGFGETGHTWSSSTTPTGFFVPRVEIPKTEGLTCYMTNYAALLDKGMDYKKFTYQASFQFGMVYKMPESADGKYLIAPYDEIKGLDQVICKFSGTQPINLDVTYSFLTPVAGRFPAKFKNEILKLYAPFTEKTVTYWSPYKEIKKSVEEELSTSDEFFLKDYRYDELESFYSEWKKTDFALNHQIVSTLSSTLGLYMKDARFKIEPSELNGKNIGDISKGSMITLYLNGGGSVKKGLYWYPLNTGGEYVKGLKKLFMGKQRKFTDPDSAPFAITCSIGGEKVYDSSINVASHFIAPKDGLLICRMNMPLKYSKSEVNLQIGINVFDAKAAKFIVEAFLKDEERFVERYSKEIVKARLQAIEDHIQNIKNAQ